MKIQTVIIGKESNFSSALLKNMEDLIVISARDILKNTFILSVFCNKKIICFKIISILPMILAKPL